MKIGIIGFGFVGKAVASAYYDVEIHDPLYKEDSISISEMKDTCDAIFVCVPTPQGNDGRCNTSILEDTLFTLSSYDKPIICKSTASPVVYRELQDRYHQLKLVHAPEFLTAANAVIDYLNPINIVIGCKKQYQREAFDIIKSEKINFDFSKTKYCTIDEASMFKYVANTMLAMKVIMNNEYYDLCNSLGINYDNVANIAKTDPRLGNTHWQVPGPDKRRGFGGACFPKDTSALSKIADQSHVNMSMLETAIIKNKTYRP
jgi:UDPglucose 6-dehydrogenase